MSKLKGNISSISLPTVFELLTKGKRTGILSVKSSDVTKNIFFEKGKVIFASADISKTKLGDLLVQRGIITAKNRDEALKLQNKEKLKFGEALMKLGKISENDLIKFLRTQAEEELYNLLHWNEGAYHFKDCELPKEGIVAFAASTQNLFSDGSQSLAELKALLKYFPNTESKLTPVDIQTLENVNLSLEQWQLFSLVDGQKTIRDMCVVSKTSELNTLKLLQQLSELGIIIVEGVEREKQKEADIEFGLNVFLYAEVFKSIFNRLYRFLSAKTGKNALAIQKKHFQEFKMKYLDILEKIEIDNNGVLPIKEFLRAIMSLPFKEQYQTMKEILNNYYISLIVLYKDILGDEMVEKFKQAISREVEDNFKAYKKAIEKFHGEFADISNFLEDVHSSFHRGRTAYENGEFDKAVEELKKVPVSNPHYNQIYELLQIAKRKADQKDAAPETKLSINEWMGSLDEALVNSITEIDLSDDSEVLDNIAQKEVPANDDPKDDEYVDDTLRAFDEELNRQLEDEVGDDDDEEEVEKEENETDDEITDFDDDDLLGMISPFLDEDKPAASKTKSSAPKKDIHKFDFDDSDPLASLGMLDDDVELPEDPANQKTMPLKKKGTGKSPSQQEAKPGRKSNGRPKAKPKTEPVQAEPVQTNDNEIEEEPRDEVLDAAKGFIETYFDDEVEDLAYDEEDEDDIQDEPQSRSPNNAGDALDDEFFKQIESFIDDASPKPYSQSSTPAGDDDLESSSVAPEQPTKDAVSSSKEKFDEGIEQYRRKNYFDALELFTEASELNPNDIEAKRYIQMSQEKITRAVSEHVKDDTVLRLDSAKASHAKLNSTQGFIISKIDGRLKVRELIRMTGMKKMQFLKEIAGLVEQKVVIVPGMERAKRSASSQSAGEETADSGGFDENDPYTVLELPPLEKEPADYKVPTDIDRVESRVLERKLKGQIYMALRRFEQTDYYQFMNVKKSTPKHLLKKAYMIQTKKCNPDIIRRIIDDDLRNMARDLFRKYTHVYNVLTDETKRKMYDITMKEDLEAQLAKKREATLSFQAGMRAYQEKRYNEAIDCFEKAIVIAPRNPVYHDMLTQCRELIHDKKGVVRWKSAEMALNENNLDDAIKHMKAALEINTNHLPWLKKLIETLKKDQKRTEELIPYMKQLIEMEPTKYENYLNLAKIFMKLRNKKEAVEYYYLAYKWSQEKCKEAKEALDEMEKEKIIPTDIKNYREALKRKKEMEKAAKKKKKT